MLKSATFDLEKGHKISTKEKSKTGIYFHENDEDLKIFHLIFANEGSEAGNYYNDYALEFLENYLQNVISLKPFDAIETVKERFIIDSKEIIEKADNFIKKENFEGDNKLIKLNTSENITLKRCLIDELGFSNLKGTGFEPVYNYYKKGDKIILRVEAPGNSKIKANVEQVGEYKIIRVIGNKKTKKEKSEFYIYYS